LPQSVFIVATSSRTPSSSRASFSLFHALLCYFLRASAPPREIFPALPSSVPLPLRASV
jgi:hypothetical protein